MSSSEHLFRVRRLYKLIFRVHRALPPELRILGDNYARDEFKRHKDCNPEEARIFLSEWTDYAINLAKQMKPLQQAKRKTVGKYLDPQMLDYMTDEQLVQLYELHKAASEPSDESGDVLNVEEKEHNADSKNK
ncbi:succinate dehydrogenase assembly factor 3, mitochondrial [Galleria mellonella]|uniref:Succinate dehydrogenase assembly factor 3 n=1 Tax=Galleria mellonella TaxID=7137 RepID=A0A6J3C1G0_GALME|nr:succinate dehydrogenase assembly factor 3, mitochondrial [Galleria mellonella]XP_031767503.1 succinate dehydrogenase assembly factor 3, mitochondrial [Galleria mellonella]